MKTIILVLLRLAFLLTPCFPRAQEPLDIAREYVRAHLSEWGLTQQDLEGMTVNDQYTDKSSGITRVYFLQRHQGIPVYNAILNLSITNEGKVFFAGNRFVSDLANKVNTTAPALSASEAVSKLVAHLGLPAEELRLREKDEASQFTFEKGKLARQDIQAVLSYQPHGGKVLLAWHILLAPASKIDKWSTRVDAVTGAVLHEFNWTVYCHVGGGSFGGAREQADFTDEDFFAEFTGAQYNVWPPPYESPVHGPRTLVSNPADPIASPYGWHDWNGQPGAESTETIGNNATAFLDRDNTGTPDNDLPNGGANLSFDAPFHPSWEPYQHADASVVNLFFWANYMHDFAYRFGFDEPAGNFQFNTYGKGGVGYDQMNCVAQSGADAGFSDNPHYVHGNEGETGTIYMTEATPAYKYLTVNHPASIAGIREVGIAAAGWGVGAYITNIPVGGEVVLVNDGIEEPFSADGCEPIVNASELAGKIAFFDRGGCQISDKAWQAQNAGAVGVIVCNQYDEYVSQIYPGNYGANVNIPVVFISAAEGKVLREYIGNGLNVSFVKANLNPEKYDECLDNSVIAHEYGHGITWRLMGGPNAVCVDNNESPDEGWSDFFALATTALPGDTGAKKRGWAAYALGEQANGLGSRRFYYSTDMNINPLTYGNLAASLERHDVGEVWGNMIWDMYWAFSDKYGWSADPYLETSGNHKAIRLVFEGLKNLSCHPGFVDARNAILAADSALYNGENACLIWSVFARRGLGYSAQQGSPFIVGDEKEAFDVPSSCANKLIIEKTATGFIQPGDDIQVSIKVGNFKSQTATNVVVTDEIPAGASFKAGSSSLPANVQGNTVSFNLGNMHFMQELVVTYTLTTAPTVWSQRKFLDDVPSSNNSNWLTSGTTLSNTWTITNAYPAHSGAYSWYAKEVPEASLQRLELNTNAYTFHVSGSRPALRFYHRYQTIGGINGGIVEVKEIGAPSWKQVDDKMLRNSYPRQVNYQTFTAPDIAAFSGISGGDFEASYVDLSEWTGKDIQIRFRLSCVMDTATGFGWLIDDIEFMDLLAYNGEACVTTAQGELECATAPEAGTIVDSRAEAVGTIEQANKLVARIFPNPATDRITVELADIEMQNVTLSLLSAGGRQLLAQTFRALPGSLLNMDTRSLPAGFYFLKISSRESQMMEKIVIQH